MIIAFSELDCVQRQLLRVALLTTPQRYDDDEAMRAVLGGAHFEHGANTLTAWRDNMPRGTLAVVTREAPRNGQVFATRAAVLEPDAAIVNELVERAVALGRAAGGRRLMLGVAPAVRPHWPEPEGFTRAYDALELAFPITRRIPPPEVAIDLRAVSDDDAEVYREVLNTAFADSPNGATESAEDIARHRAAPGARLFIGVVDQRPALAAYLLVNDGDFVIDSIGVVPAARRGGVGRALLRTLLQMAHDEGATRVSLTVIDSNTRALDLYLSEGFERVQVLTHWLTREL